MTPGSASALQLGRFVSGLELQHVPARVVSRARMQLLDSIGVGLAASRFPFARSAASGFALLDGGDAVAFGLGRQFGLRDALILNGMLIHGIEFEDTSIEGRVHPSAFCASTALSLAAALHLCGGKMLIAYIAGLEAAIRIGAAANGTLSKRGFDATSIVGAFGAALVAGRLLGLDAEQLATAQGIAYGAASGNREFTAAMAWTKRFHPGWAASAGYTAALLARGGFVAPSEPYEGRFGLYQLYSGELAQLCDPTVICDDLGERWLLDGISFKPVPACFFNIPAVDAAAALVREHRIDPDRITRVVVRIPEAAINTVCEPHAIRRRPPDAYVGQFSLFHTVAATLVRGGFGLADLEPAALADSRVAALADKIEYEADPASSFPRHYTAWLSVTTSDGQTFEHREDIHRGSPERPLSDEDLVTKFLANAEPVIGAQGCRTVLALVLDPDQDRLEDVARLIDLLAGEHSPCSTEARASAGGAS